ncbi:MAG: hypothetical protein BMS9Abin31_1208 [Gammaproteobacteria bacterium]|nr:MAG: hypothetical protein BMS9Abin31_1208 [Gammaproteobacteria bacterium]
MNSDFRLSVSFIDHPKTVKLQRRLGAESVVCLIRLFGWIAQNKPQGVLEYASSNATSIDLALLKNSIIEDIEIAAKWTGKESLLYSTLVDLHFIDEAEKSISIHNWEQHNPYAFHANDRKTKAKLAAKARWCKGDDQAMLRASSSNAPSPDPSPDPSLKKKKGKNKFPPPSLSEVADYCKQRQNNIDPESFISFYESKGWMVGKNKMQSWKASIVTWEKRNQTEGKTNENDPRSRAKRVSDTLDEPAREAAINEGFT